jgi:hypothetical protein
MRQKILLLIIFNLLLIPCFAQSTKVKLRKKLIARQAITETDKSNIVKLFLNKSDSDNPDQVFYLSTENLPKNFTSNNNKTLDGIKIEYVDREQIKKNSVYGFGYYFFEPFEIRGNEVVVTFGKRWSNATYGASKSSGGKYNCKKVGKKWKCNISEITTVDS